MISKLKKYILISLPVFVLPPIAVVCAKVITNNDNSEIDNITPPIVETKLEFNKNLTSASFGWDNLSVDKAFEQIDKWWVIKNKQILFKDAESLKTSSDVLVLEKRIYLDPNNNSYIILNINDTIGNISNIKLIDNSSNFYNISTYPLAQNYGLNINSSILETNKLYEAMVEYLVNQFNNEVNKSHLTTTDYVLNNRQIFAPKLENTNLSWNFDLKDKSKDLKNAIALSFFKMDWNTLIDSSEFLNSIISNIKIFGQIVENDFLSQKFEFTKIEITFNDDQNPNSKQIIEINNSQFTKGYSFVSQFNRDDKTKIGTVVLANQNLSFSLETLSPEILLEKTNLSADVLNKNMKTVTQNISLKFIFDNKDVIFQNSKYLLKENFIESIGSLEINNNYDSIDVNIKWKNLTEITNFKFKVSQNNRLINAGLTNLYTAPYDSTNKWAVEIANESQSEILSRTGKFIWNRQINDFKSINNKEYGFTLPEYKAVPKVSSTNDSVILQMNGWNNDQALKDTYTKMMFRTIWKTKWEDIRNQNIASEIIPNVNDINDIEIEWKVEKTTKQSNSLVTYTVFPYLVRFKYYSNPDVAWLFDKQYAIDQKIAYPIYFAIDPSVAQIDYLDYKITD